MNPTILGVIGPAFLNQVPTVALKRTLKGTLNGTSQGLKEPPPRESQVPGAEQLGDPPEAHSGRPCF